MLILNFLVVSLFNGIQSMANIMYKHNLILKLNLILFFLSKKFISTLNLYLIKRKKSLLKNNPSLILALHQKIDLIKLN